MRRYLKNGIIMVSVLSFLHGMTDGVDYFIFKNSEVDVVHEYYRLFYVLSLITAAILYDKFKYYQMLLAILATGLLILAFQLYNTEYFNVVHYLDSICSGFILVFIMNIFAEASAVTDKPWMWCNLGRIIQFALNSIGSVISVWLLEQNLTATSQFIFMILSSYGLVPIWVALTFPLRNFPCPSLGFHALGGPVVGSAAELRTPALLVEECEITFAPHFYSPLQLHEV